MANETIRPRGCNIIPDSCSSPFTVSPTPPPPTPPGALANEIRNGPTLLQLPSSIFVHYKVGMQTLTVGFVR